MKREAFVINKQDTFETVRHGSKRTGMQKSVWKGYLGQGPLWSFLKDLILARPGIASTISYRWKISSRSCRTPLENENHLGDAEHPVTAHKSGLAFTTTPEILLRQELSRLSNYAINYITISCYLLTSTSILLRNMLTNLLLLQLETRGHNPLWWDSFFVPVREILDCFAAGCDLATSLRIAAVVRRVDLRHVSLLLL